MCEPLMGLLGDLLPYKSASLRGAPARGTRQETRLGFSLLFEMVTEA